MASFGAPGGCAQQGRVRQAEAGHSTQRGQALGGLARSCYGSRAAVETGERFIKMCV